MQKGLIDETSALLEKMDRNGCSPHDCTFNTIIQGLLQHNETSRAMKYLHMMVEKGFSANATIATMFINLLSSNQADNNIQELLKKSTWRPLSFKLLNVKNNFHILTRLKSICKWHIYAFWIWFFLHDYISFKSMHKLVCCFNCLILLCNFFVR